jgi:hypothetical protein
VTINFVDLKVLTLGKKIGFGKTEKISRKVKVIKRINRKMELNVTTKSNIQ